MKLYEITVNNQVYQVSIRELSSKQTPMVGSFPEESQRSGDTVDTAQKKITAPLAGTVLKINVKAGDVVKKGEQLLVLEALKMENEIVAPENGRIQEILVKEKQTVETQELLMTIQGSD